MVAFNHRSVNVLRTVANTKISIKAIGIRNCTLYSLNNMGVHRRCLACSSGLSKSSINLIAGLSGIFCRFFTLAIFPAGLVLPRADTHVSCADRNIQMDTVDKLFENSFHIDSKLLKPDILLSNESHVAIFCPQIAHSSMQTLYDTRKVATCMDVFNRSHFSLEVTSLLKPGFAIVCTGGYTFILLVMF